MLRPLVAALLLVTTFAPQAAAPASAASTFNVLGGSASGDGAIQLLAFMPNEISVNVGDTVEWKFLGGTEHTITFAAVAGANAANPFCNGLASSADPCVWTGTGMVNSGRKNEGETYGITFNAPPGNYQFICLVHAAAPQSGTLHLRAAGTAYPQSPSAVNAEAKTQEAAFIQQGSQLRGQELAAADPQNGKINVGAGFHTDTAAGRQVVSIDRFLPQNVTVNVGEEVTWTALDTVVPHTVSFGNRPVPPNAPTGTDLPGHATLTHPYPQLFTGTPTVSSGFMGQGPGRPGGTTFTAKFNAPGVYQYYCTLHDGVGMVGTVNVVPVTNDSTIQKSVSPSQGTVGGTVTFTVTLNLGSPQAGVEVRDVISGVGQSPATAYVAGSARHDTTPIPDPDLLTNQPNRIEYRFRMGDLEAGEHTLTFEVKLSGSLGCYTTASNGATLDATGVSGNLGSTNITFPVRCAPNP